jgi:hypothetical protein
VTVTGFCGMPPGPRFFIQIFCSKWRIPAVLEAVPQCRHCRGACRDVSGPTDEKSGFISSSTFYYWCFLEREVEAATPYQVINPEYTHENNKTHVQYCFITIFCYTNTIKRKYEIILKNFIDTF